MFILNVVIEIKTKHLRTFDKIYCLFLIKLVINQVLVNNEQEMGRFHVLAVEAM